MSAKSSIELGEIMASKSGSVDPSKYPDEVFDLYSIPAFDSGEPEVLAGKKIGSAKQIVAPGDVLLSRIVPHIRRSWVVGANRGRRIIASGEWIVFRSEKVCPGYLRHVLVGDWFHAEFMSTVSGVGGSLLRARPAHVAKIRISLPPLPEQRQIAGLLDRAEALRAKRRGVLVRLGTLSQAIFVDLFGDPAMNPRGWPQRAIKELGKVTTGGTPPSGKRGMFDGPIPFVTPGDLESDALPRRGVTDAGAGESVTVRPGATFVCCIGATIGKIGKAAVSSAFNQQINAVEWGEAIDDSYGFAVLRFFKPTIIAWGASTTLPILKKSAFERIEIPVPPIDLQCRFSRILSAVNTLEGTSRASLASLDELFGALQSRAFRGGL